MRKPVGHWLSVLIPLSTIPLVPLVMMIRTGSRDLSGDGGMALTTVEGFALAQFIIVILRFRSLIFKSGTEELMMNAIPFIQPDRGCPTFTVSSKSLAYFSI